MAHPLRIQRRRTKLWRMPDDAVYVGRPTKWGNPFRVGRWIRSNLHPYDFVCVADAEMAVLMYRTFIMGILARDRDALDELRGKRLACWCSLKEPFCHADVLAELANRRDGDLRR